MTSSPCSARSCTAEAAEASSQPPPWGCRWSGQSLPKLSPLEFLRVQGYWRERGAGRGGGATTWWKRSWRGQEHWLTWELARGQSEGPYRPHRSDTGAVPKVHPWESNVVLRPSGLSTSAAPTPSPPTLNGPRSWQAHLSSASYPPPPPAPARPTRGKTDRWCQKGWGSPVYMTEVSQSLCTVNFWDSSKQMPRPTHLVGTQGKPCMQVPLVIKPATYPSGVVCLVLWSLLTPRHRLQISPGETPKFMNQHQVAAFTPLPRVPSQLRGFPRWGLKPLGPCSDCDTGTRRSLHTLLSAELGCPTVRLSDCQREAAAGAKGGLCRVV